MAATDGSTERRWLRRAPVILAAGVGVFLVTALAVVLVVDVFDALGLRRRFFVERASDYPWAFYHLFSEGRPVEWAQWSLLLLAGAAVAFCAGRLHAAGHVRRAWGVALLGLAVAALAVKDAGNPRHAAAQMAEGMLGERAATLVELAVFGAVATLAVAGLAAAWSELRRRPAARRLFVAAYGAYGAAALMSATSDLWYRQAGSALLEGPLGGRLLPAPEGWEPGLRTWLVMDSVAEESLELVAAGLLAVAALVLLKDVTASGTRPAAADGNSHVPAAKSRR